MHSDEILLYVEHTNVIYPFLFLVLMRENLKVYNQKGETARIIENLEKYFSELEHL